MFYQFITAAWLYLRLWVQAFSRSESYGSLSLRGRLLRVLLATISLPVFLIHWLGLLFDEVLFPSYRRIEVKNPLFILGVPRSGTTFLHRLLEEDKNSFTSVTTWEALLAPSISQRLFWRGVGRVDRLFGGPGRWLLKKLEKRLFAGMEGVHEMALDAAEEDYLLLIPIFSCFILFLPFVESRYIWRLSRMDWDMPGHERRRILDFYHACLQKHLYVHGQQRRYLAKNAAFASWIDNLSERYPDADFVICMRDPQRAVPSLLGSLSGGAAFFDLDLHSGLLPLKLTKMMERYYRHLLSPRFEKYPIVHMDALKANPQGSVQDLYRQLDIPLAEEYAGRLRLLTDRASRFQTRTRPIAAAGAEQETDFRRQFSCYYRRFDADRSPPAAQAVVDKPAAIEQPVVSAPGLIPLPLSRLLEEGGYPPQQLRIAVLSDALKDRNGVDAYYRDLVGQLVDRVDRIELLSPNPEDGSLDSKLRIPMPGDATQEIILPHTPRLMARLAQLNPHVIIAATNGPFGMYAILAARHRQVKLLAGFHTHIEGLCDLYWGKILGPITRTFMESQNRLLFYRAESIVVNSHTMVEPANRLSRTPVTLMETPVDRRFVDEPITAPSENVQRLLYAGRLAPEKNVQAFVDAAAAHPDLNFSIAGDGPMRAEVEERAADLSNLVCLGHVPRSTIVSLIDAHDMLVLPSHLEAFGTIALEGMMRQRLVLVSSHCGILSWPSLARGLYQFPPQESLAEAIGRTLAVDPRLQEAKTRLARESALALHQQAIDKWLALLVDSAGMPKVVPAA